MRSRKTDFQPVALSLEDILGSGYTSAVCAAREFLRGEKKQTLEALATRKIDFFPQEMQARLLELLPRVGESCLPALGGTPRGAATNAFGVQTRLPLAPLSGLAFYRLTENGQLFLTAKSEHYHASLGHAFAGYGLVEHARRLGIPNATHNNTRGYITRLLEEELVRAAAGLPRGGRAALEGVLDSKAPGDLNRTINLETGSLAVEAALKMVLSRFYKPQADSPEPRYQGRIPVLVVLGDEEGRLEANYHGTTVIAQTLRGMWPRIAAGLEDRELLLVRCIRPERLDELQALLEKYDKGRTKVAAFVHELILMNYGGTRLSESFVCGAHALCKTRDVATIVDEIQTCVWSPEVFLFREYGIRPNCVVVGKGFPGGEFAASRVLLDATLDTLPQFGALVTNGQEELASLAYLVTLRWLEANADVVREVGRYYHERLDGLASRQASSIREIRGKGHMAGIYFHDVETGKKFAQALNRSGIDISVQTYKKGCPPSALTKLPLVAGFEVVDLLVDRMEKTLEAM